MFMRRILLIASLAIASAALRAGAALQFVGVPSTTSGTLNAATCDPNSSFVAVGTNSSVLTGTFATDHIAWSSNGVPLATSLVSATFGNGIFLAGTTGGNVVSSANGLTWGSQTSPFTNFTAYVSGLAFNPRTTINPNFVAAPQLFEIAYSHASLPLAWVGATIDSFNLGESWRAVAPFGVSNFIACGFQGDIRYSTNNGTSWFLSRLPNSSFPDLLGIASDGTNRIVAVGNLGTILFSSNGGSSWSAAASPAAGGTNLYAVEWDDANQQFMVVGNSGVVMTSANGTSWTLQNLGFGQPLYGVTVANTGILAGVSFLVGNNGRAWLAGTPPAAPITPIGLTICAPAVQTNEMRVSVTNDVAHPAGSVGVDWYNNSGARVLANSLSFVPTNTFAPPDAPATYTYYAVTRDLRTGFTNTAPVAVTLTINPRPTASVTGTNTICNGQSTVVHAALTGLGPTWNVTWSSNGVVVATHLGVSGGADTLTVSPRDDNLNASTNALYVVSALTDISTGCTNNQPGDLKGGALITINPRPTASLTISTNDFSCTSTGGTNLLVSVSQVGTNLEVRTQFSYPVTNYEGGSGKIKSITNVSLSSVTLYVTNHATFTGIGAWSTIWEADAFDTAEVPSGTSTATNLTALTNGIYVWAVTISNSTPGTNFTFLVTDLTDAHCTAGAAGLPAGIHVVVNGTLSGNVYLSGGNTICSGGSAVVAADLGGKPPWTLVWNDGTTNTATSTPFQRLVNPTNYLVNLPTNYSFWITNLSDSTPATTSSSNDLTGGATLTVDPVPVYPPEPVGTNFYVSCTNVQLTLSVTVTNGFTADWFADPGRSVLLLPGSTSFVTPVINLGANTILTNTYYVAARFNDTNYEACVSTNLTQFTLVSQPCTNQLFIVNSGTNHGTIQWYGNFVLQAATDLTPPVVWTPVWTGSVAPNSFSWSNPPPVQYFRLYAPTN